MHRKFTAWRPAAALMFGTVLLATMGIASPVAAADGDNLRTIIVDRTGTDCASFNAAGDHNSVGVGVAFDGVNLLVSCYSDNTITENSPADGSLVAVHHITGVTSLGALAWDNGRGVVWACGNFSTIGTINLATNVYTPVFDPVGGCFDGLAYDASDDTLWSGFDANNQIDHSTTTGTHIATFAPGISRSGIAVGGDLIYMADNGGQTIWRSPKDFSAVTEFASFSRRLEDLECDDLTFGTQLKAAIWVNDAYDNILNAFEIPLGSCAFGGGGGEEPDSLTPAVVNETLPAGESTTVEKTLHLNGLPAEADIIVAIDTTASMSGALVSAKADAVQICEDVKDEIPGARFAAVEFQDYPISPYGATTDSPYELHTAGYTADCATFGLAVAAMTLGNGADGPESNNRVHFEAYSDSVLLASRDADATRFLVVLADNVPHSTVAFGDCPATIDADGTPLSDPGRNGVNEEGAGDDIETPDAIDGLNADDHTLLYISYNRGSPLGSAVHPCHEDLAVATGGVAVASNDAEDIGAFIIEQAQETPYTVDLEISAGCEIGFSFDPAPPYGPFTGEQTILFTETITAPEVVGDYTCTITAVMTPGGPTTAVETVNVTVVPGDPATLELEPATDTNTVDEEHCVTATVEDAFGNPTPGVTVEFSVSGPGETEGSVVTDDDGEAEFCYTSALPGEDDISAFADTNDNGAQDPGEPSDTATKTWVIPASTEGCRVTNGGWIIATNGDQATFGGNAQADGLRGEQEYQDHGPAVVMNVHSIDVLAVECSSDGTEASIFGTATVDGEGEFDYRIDLKDLGDSGTDTYRLRLSNGYDSGEQDLSGGNVRIH